MRFFPSILQHWKQIVSKTIIVALLFNYGIGPAFHGFDANQKIKEFIQTQQISNIKNIFTTNIVKPFMNSFVAKAQSSIVPKPVITPPEQVSNAVPIVRGTKLPSQSRIIFCREGKICPQEGLVVAEGGQVNFSISLSPLDDGRNDFAFIAEGDDGEFSEQVGFSVFFQSEASAQQNIIPADLETCLGDALAQDPGAFANSRFGFPSNEPFRDNFARQSRDIFGSLPDDGRSFGAFSAFSQEGDRLGFGSTDPLSEPRLLLDEINTFQERIRPDPLADVVGVEDVFGTPAGNITGASSLRGGFFPSARRSAINTVQSKILGGSRIFRFCVEQVQSTINFRNDDITENTPIGGFFDTSIPQIESDINDIGGIGLAGGSNNNNGFFDQNGNFVLFDEAGPIGAGPSNQIAFSDVGRAFTDPLEPIGQDGIEAGNDFDQNPEEDDDGLCGDACAYAATGIAGVLAVAAAVTAAGSFAAIGTVSLAGAGIVAAGGGGLGALGGVAAGLVLCIPCIAIAVVLIVVLLVLTFLCPSYYFEDANNNDVFLTNGLLTFINKQREGKDLILIGSLKDKRSQLSINIKEHLDELLYINQLQLRSIIHAKDSNILNDQNSEIQDISSAESIEVKKQKTIYDIKKAHYFSRKTKAFLKPISELKNIIPQLHLYFENKFPQIISALASKDVYEIEVPKSELIKPGNIKLVINGTFSPQIKAKRLQFMSNISPKDADMFYNYINTQCIECQTAANEILDEIFGLEIQTFNTTKQYWEKVPGKLLLERQTKVFTIPQQYTSSKIRIITQKNAYILGDIKITKNNNENIILEKNVETNNVFVQHDLRPKQKINASILHNIDDEYTLIDYGDRIDATFNLDNTWKKEKELENKYQKDFDVSFFIDNTGYYELLRSLP
jgi:hypothetical protein